MFAQLLSIIRGRAEEPSTLPQISGNPLEHIAIVSPDSRFGVIRITTDLNPNSPNHSAELQGVAEAISQTVGWPARAITQLNEVQLISLPKERVDTIATQLTDIANRMSDELGGVLTDHQQQQLGRIETSAAHISTLSISGISYLIVKLPFSPTHEQEGHEIAALVRNMLRERTQADISSNWDGSRNEVRVNIPNAGEDVGRELLQRLQRLGGKTFPALE